MIILDTNVISGLMREPPEEVVRQWLNGQPRPSVWTTAVTVMEIRFGLTVMAISRLRTRLEQQFAILLDHAIESRVLPFDANAAEETAALMARRRRSGQSGDVRDAMIAGIAIARHATLATRNTRHFADLPVPVVNPWSANG